MIEYEACFAVLKAAFDMYVKDWKVYEDSILIITRSTGEREIRISEVVNYKGYLTKLHKAFRSISFNYLSCSKN